MPIDSKFKRFTKKAKKEGDVAESEQQLVNLWKKVIRQAVRDCCSSNARTRLSVVKWMESGDFHQTCRDAGITKVKHLKEAIMLVLKLSQESNYVMAKKAAEAIMNEINSFR